MSVCMDTDISFFLLADVSIDFIYCMFVLLIMYFCQQVLVNHFA